MKGFNVMRPMGWMPLVYQLNNMQLKLNDPRNLPKKYSYI